MAGQGSESFPVGQAVPPSGDYGPPPSLTRDEAKTLSSNLYGFRVVRIRALPSFVDQNFHISVQTDSGGGVSEFIMKIINAKESANLDFLRGSVDILLYLKTNGIRCPEPVELSDGGFLSWYRSPVSGSKHAVFMLTYVPGIPLSEVKDVPASLYHSLGVFLGKIDSALQKFHHQGFRDKESIWRMESIPFLRDYLSVIDDEGRRKLVTSAVKSFEDDVVPNYEKLRQGIIHGDYDPYNVIIARRHADVDTGYSISGIIDFGDAKYSFYLFEIAVTIAQFLLMIGSENAKMADQVLVGYETEFPLTSQERALLSVCTLARLAQVAVLSSFELLSQPTNEYIESIALKAWQSLEYHTHKPVW